MKTKENQRGGISLIVLVITIIVIIILAAAVILSLNNNNPITNAKKATVQSDLKTYTDELSLYVANKYTETMGAFNLNEINAQAEAMNTYISSMQTKYHNIVEIELGKLVIREGVTGDEKLWAEEILGYGKIGKVMESNMTIDGLTTGTATNPIIPKGFAPINTDTSIWGTTDGVSKGLVIEDKTTDSTTAGNQFVWIPVEDFSKFKRTDAYMPFGGYLVKQCAEETPSEASKDSEIGKMYKSVKDNQGFYIARYEAGKPTGTVAMDGTVKPISRKNADVWSEIPWGETNSIDNPGNGAVIVSRAMYSENINVGVRSTLMYGVQHDAILIYLDTSNSKTIEELKNSITWGNYKDSEIPADVNGYGFLQKTGFSDYWKANNIYDLAGNVWEITMESLPDKRIHRAGAYTSSGLSSAAYRADYAIIPINMNINVGFRPALYIK